MQKLRMEPVKDVSQGSGPTLERLVADLRQNEFQDLARYFIIRQRDSKLFGFNAPHTLLCPAPGLADDDWAQLWCDLTDATDGRAWRTSQSWGLTGERARGCIGGWIEKLRTPDSPVLPPWAEAIRSAHRKPFGVRNWLSMYSESEGFISIPLPAVGPSDWEGLGKKLASSEPEEFLKKVPELKKYNGYQMCWEFRIRDREGTVKLIWKEHLDALQEHGLIFAWKADAGKEILEILWDLKRTVHFAGTRVVDEEAIRIPTCIALAQRHVPASSRRETATLYPDLPIRPEYLALVRTEQGDNLARTARQRSNRRRQTAPR